MNTRFLFLTGLLCTALAHSTHADEFRTPAEMTKEDWEVVNLAQGDYSACLQEKTVQYNAISDDPRIISDKVLDECSHILVQLDKDMNNLNINPHFTRRYIYNTKNKAAQKLLRNLMMMIAVRQQNDTATEENNAPAEQ